MYHSAKKTKYFTMILAFFMALCFFNFTKVYAEPVEVTADGAVLIDELTGEVLYDKNKDEQFPPASTTKIMTALLVLEKSNLDDLVTVCKECEPVEGSKIYIFEGEQMTVRDLLHALMKVSANDAAIALAKHISGSTEDFAKLMTERAKELGCKNTTFKNPHGLYQEGHVTTAYDLSLIMRELMKQPNFKEIASSYSYEIQPTNKCNEVRPLWNQNYLLYPENPLYYKYAEAGKTGYTDESLHSYVASAKKDGTRLIAAFLHDGKKTFFKDAKNLFEYGFNNFQVVKAVSKDDVLAECSLKDNSSTIPLVAKNDLYVVKNLSSDKEISDIKLSTEDITFGREAVAKGTKLTTASVSYNGEIFNVDVVSGTDYVPPVLTFKDKLKDFTKTNTFNLILGGILVLFLLFILLIFRVRSIRKKRRLMKKYNIHVSSPNLYRSNRRK